MIIMTIVTFKKYSYTVSKENTFQITVLHSVNGCTTNGGIKST